MNPLHRTQTEFQNYLLRRNGPIVADVVGDERVDAHGRLDIYADAYRLRLIEALEGDFVVLRAYVGAERFDDIARVYIETHPSEHFSLRYYGQRLARFLADTAPYKNEPLLAELATFDWALTDSFDAADSPVATVDDMARIAPNDWPQLVFVPHASVQRLNLEWNAPILWKAADKDEPLPLPERRPILSAGSCGARSCKSTSDRCRWTRRSRSMRYCAEKPSAPSARALPSGSTRKTSPSTPPGYSSSGSPTG